MANESKSTGNANRSGLSLYANLLDSGNNAPGTISSAPVTYNRPAEGSVEDENAKKQQALAASLRFQPTKRPQLAAQKAKAKAIASKLGALSKTPAAQIQEGSVDESKQEPASESTSTSKGQQQASGYKTTAADWLATAEDDNDVNAYYAGSRQRGGRKKRKKNNKDSAQQFQQDWDDIYDPSRPNNYEEYKNSEEKIREVREWKDLLYRRRIQRRASSQDDSNSEAEYEHPRSKQFAPPTMLFAPPVEFSEAPPPPPDDDDEYIPPAAAEMPVDASGDDAYARRTRLGAMHTMPPSLPPPPPPPPPPSQQAVQAPIQTEASIARAPVRYSLPAADPNLPATEAELQEMEIEQDEQEDAPRSTRPGQAKFAERLMAKYGWAKGQGLGKEGTGVTSALYAKADKRKKKSDAEGGGYVTPAQTGRILGGDKNKLGKAADEGKFGNMSEVVRLEGMLLGLDIQAEMMREDANIMQEIGEECNDKYGNVERVYIHADTQSGSGAFVFVHFTAQLSALRAVNALEGRVFNGNAIKARFWNKEKFDQGQYE